MDVHPRILTEIWDVPDAHKIEVAEAHGRYTAAAKALKMTPKDIVDEVFQSGLRGRGGAGFPTGRKWQFVPPPERRGGKPVYLLCNADESEPGTFKDRFCMWNDPHQLVEGMIISSFALGVRHAYIYLRGEFKYVQDRLDVAIQEAYAKGYLGTNIFGSGYDLDLYTHLGAGAYICGEETALISSLEGVKGQPRLKPPFPAVKGVWDAPTIVNNVETIAVVPWVINNGGAAYKAIGTEKSPGTKLFSCSGHINKPGVYEVPLGYPMMDLLNNECGGVRGGRKLKAIIPGGSSVPVMTVEEVEQANMDYESINAVAGSYLGSGGFIVMDETTDMVEALTNLLRFYAHESCGQCTPCREGCGWMFKILERLCAGEADHEDLDTLKDLADNIHSRTICFFGASAAMPVQSFLQKFGDEFTAKIDAARRIELPPGVSVAK
ncbi:MAG: NADH-quinone oxidoreductase subunit NuoF [Alphaproteobacteria bacterium]|nr:NADH-quinone oxidoreductase subunit NuoF [Alphaproteobacteria bacterium]